MATAGSRSRSWRHCVRRGRGVLPRRAVSRPVTGSRSGRRTRSSGSSPRSARVAAGAALVPLNTRFKGDEAAYILDRSRRACSLFTRRGFLGNDYAAMLRTAGIPRPSVVTARRRRVVGRRRLPRRRSVDEPKRRRSTRAGRHRPTSSSRRARPGGQGRRDHARPDPAGLRRPGATSSGCARATATSSSTRSSTPSATRRACSPA